MRDAAGFTANSTSDAVAGSYSGGLATARDAARAGPDSGKDRWDPEAHTAHADGRCRQPTTAFPETVSGHAHSRPPGLLTITIAIASRTAPHFGKVQRPADVSRSPVARVPCVTDVDHHRGFPVTSPGSAGAYRYAPPLTGGGSDARYSKRGAVRRASPTLGSFGCFLGCFGCFF